MMARVRKLSTEITPNWVFVMLLAVVFFEYVRPTEWFLFFLRPLRIAGFITFGMLLVFLAYPKNYLKTEPIHRACLIFFALAGCSVLWAYNNNAAFWRTMNLFWVLAAFTFPINVILTTKERIYKFCYFWVLVLSILGLFVITHGGHGTGSYLEDENDCGLVLNMGVPFAVFLMQFPGQTKMRKFLLALALLILLVAVGRTDSRGAVVGLVGVLITVIWMSKRPVFNAIWVSALGAVTVLVMMRVMSQAYIADMENMANPNDPTRDERIWSWSIGWVMFKENPVWGVGAGNYPWTNHLYAEKSPMWTPKRRILGGREAHSLYFTLLPEYGVVGTSAFVYILYRMYRRYRTMRRCYRSRESPTDDEKRFNLLFITMMATVAAFLLTSTFISVLYYPPFWHVVGMLTAIYRVAVRDVFPDAEPVEEKAPRGARLRRA